MTKHIDNDLPPPHCSNVQEYEKSNWWKNKSKKLLENKDIICPYCKRPRWVWQPRKKTWKRKTRFCVHHKRYDNVPYEKEDDLIIICWQCHSEFHAILRLENLSAIFKELALIVRKYFVYDTGSAGRNNYFTGVPKWKKEKNI